MIETGRHGGDGTGKVREETPKAPGFDQHLGLLQAVEAFAIEAGVKRPNGGWKPHPLVAYR
ncbi:hypothetical protein [Acidocella aminolytica]|uniref:hypothetical protein n=1 Tax=Acidocella aminolytica TaxID=33998 RepID=UPI00111477C2|nr:hypothetical protein [Acidocella aminolytica]